MPKNTNINPPVISIRVLNLGLHPILAPIYVPPKQNKNVMIATIKEVIEIFFKVVLRIEKLTPIAKASILVAIDRTKRVLVLLNEILQLPSSVES